MEQASALYTRLSRANNENQRAVITFNARGYGPKIDPEGKFRLETVDILTEKEFDAECEKRSTVQGVTDRAAAKVKHYAKWLTATQYGTRIHHIVEKTIGRTDPNFKAEISHMKSFEETEGEGKESPKENPPEGKQEGEVSFGTPNSIRVDVFEKKGQTVCVYDIKTGKSGLSPRRMTEIANSVSKAYGPVRILVTEVRPTLGRPPLKPRR